MGHYILRIKQQYIHTVDYLAELSKRGAILSVV
ncbi:hypothetical protein LTSEHVI_1177, partial [Salmonella enterica subsp. enterica serovar Hvittingfoss str. A4-620]